jgi:hypothetical protein
MLSNNTNYAGLLFEKLRSNKFSGNCHGRCDLQNGKYISISITR